MKPLWIGLPESGVRIEVGGAWRFAQIIADGVFENGSLL